MIVTSLPALLQPVPGREELQQATRTLRTGEQLEPETLVRWLVDQRFERVTAIELPGEFSMHGGILDVFPHADSDPLRIEFFGTDRERASESGGLRHERHLPGSDPLAQYRAAGRDAHRQG